MCVCARRNLLPSGPKVYRNASLQDLFQDFKGLDTPALAEYNMIYLDAGCTFIKEEGIENRLQNEVDHHRF